MLTEEQRKACAAYIVERARHVIETFGPRPPGSEAEAATQHLVKEELAEYCGDAWIEPFSVAQKAFMSVPRVVASLLMLSMLGWFASPWLALAFTLAGFAVLFFELIRYREFIDFLFIRKKSYNVWARHSPNGPVQRRVVLNAHPDAAYEWRFNYKYPKYFFIFSAGGIVALLIKLVLDVSFVVAGGWSGAYEGLWLWIGLGQLLLLPSALASFFYSDFGEVSPGASDNLSGTFLVTGIAKFLHESGVRPENTEIEYLVTGSEEAGLRGAKAHMALHSEEYRDVETIFFALDTFRELEHLTVYNRDLNGTLRHDPGVCALLRDAGKEAGCDLPFGSVYVGSSDGTAFAQAGHKAAALVAMDPAPAHYYHNRRDTWEDLDRPCLEKVVEVVCNAIVRYDREGLPDTAGT